MPRRYSEARVISMTLKKILENKFPSLTLESEGGCTDSDIKKSELQLAVSYPADYSEYLLDFGWLSVEHYEFFGLGKGIPDFLNINLVAHDEWESYGLDKRFLPIWNNGGGNLDCINLELSTKDKSKIFVVSHETRQAEFLTDGIQSWLCLKLDELLDD